MTTRATPRTRAGLLAAGVLLAVSAAACTGGAAGTPLSSSVPSPTAVPASSTPAAATGAEPSMEVPPVSPSVSPGEGVPPAVVQRAVDDAATRAGVDATAVTVLSADSVTWPNGAAGCPKTGFMYTDVITPGYRVVVEAGGTTFDYRGSVRSGTVTWCEDPPAPGLTGQG